MKAWVELALGSGILVLGFVAWRYYLRSSSAKKDARLLARVWGPEGGEGVLERNLRIADNEVLRQLLSGLPAVAEASELISQAGLSITVATLLGRMLTAGVVGFFIGKVIGLVGPAALVLGFLVLLLPLLQIMHLRSKRILAFEAQFPQALELLSLYLRSGRSFPQAFMAATEELPSPAADEFRVCVEEYRLGRSLDYALKNMAMRFPTSLGFRLFTIAVSVLGQTGGNLVEVLERIKRTVEQDKNYVMRLQALTGESRMSALMLGALPGIFMAFTAFMNPKYFNTLFEDAMGLFVLTMVMALWLGGVLWIRVLMKAKPT